MTRVEILVLGGSLASGVAVSFDVLASANRLLLARGLPQAFEVEVAGPGARAWRRIAPPIQPNRQGTPDILVIPGLGLADEDAIVSRLRSRPAIQARQRLETLAAGGAEIAAACSATFLLAASGLLDDRRATTSWWLAPIFRRMFPQVRLDPELLVVRDGPITTAGAAMAQLDLMLTLVSRHAGSDIAELCARYLLLDGRRSQLPYSAIGLLAAGDERVARAETWARGRLEQGVTVEQLAEAAGLAPRTFARRVERVTGMSPVRFLQRLRVERAVELAASTRLPLDEIARQVGYAEPSTLRRLLRRERVGGRGILPPVFREEAA